MELGEVKEKGKGKEGTNNETSLTEHCHSQTESKNLTGKEICSFKPTVEGNSLLQNVPGQNWPLLVTYIDHKLTQTKFLPELHALPWPPKIPVRAYVSIPRVHRFFVATV